MNWTSTTRTRRQELGLTLLEVLAAAMIFSMVMTVLIGTSSTAVHNIGVSARRLEANMLANEILTDLEIQMKQGIAPEVVENESTRDQFAIRVFRTDLVQNPEADPAGSTNAASSFALMLGPDLPEVAKHLKQYDIEVSWIEQNGPQTVSRTTFAFDWQTAATEFSDLFARSNRTGGGSGQNDDGIDGGVPGGGSTADGDGTPFGDDGRDATDGTTTTRRRGHNAREEHERRLREEIRRKGEQQPPR
jgi:hypothetical protein